ncbi:MAG: hypothetical protein ACKO4T_08580 [Planctomycetaceae bacterium]
MPIAVLCPGCKSRFSVSDKFAGQTGPCPKCKKPITIPALTGDAVVIHEPEAPTATSTGTGRAPTAPIASRDKAIPVARFAAVGGMAVAVVAGAWLTGRLMTPTAIPPAALLAAAFLLAVPCVMLGYAAVRNRELEPYTGTPLLLRSLACAAVYAGLWAVKGLLPPDATREMWQWMFLGPMFAAAGALAALAALELDWGAAVAHFSLYAMFTAFLRWLAGLSPL